MSEEFKQITGEKEGPTSIIMAGVHGDEKCGITAVEEVLPNLKLERGRVFFGYGNPLAISQSKRFIEANLNRMFKKDTLLSEEDKGSYEFGRAQYLKKYLNQSDALLDIHASRTPESRPFVICEDRAKGIAEYLPVNLVVSGFDEFEPGGTDYYMNSQGKVGICLECGFIDDPNSLEVAKKGIVAFLKARGHLENGSKEQKQTYVRVYSLYMTKTDIFTLSKDFNDFEEIKADQVIGMDGGKKIRAQKDSLIIFARNCTKKGSEAFLLGEKKDGFA